MDSTQSRYEIEMPVPTQDSKTMLAGERGDPNVVARDRSSGFLEFTAKRSVAGGGLLIHKEYPVTPDRFRQPSFIPLPVARLPDSIDVLTQRNDRHGDLIRFPKDRFQGRIAIRDG
jgi:hypothetical protein